MSFAHSTLLNDTLEVREIPYCSVGSVVSTENIHTQVDPYAARSDAELAAQLQQLGSSLLQLGSAKALSTAGVMQWAANSGWWLTAVTKQCRS